jgi:hypothetical protein
MEFDSSSAKPVPAGGRPKKLLDQVREKARLAHLAWHTEKAYVHWTRRYLLFHHLRHPMKWAPQKLKTS